MIWMCERFQRLENWRRNVPRFGNERLEGESCRKCIGVARQLSRLFCRFASFHAEKHFQVSSERSERVVKMLKVGEMSVL